MPVQSTSQQSLVPNTQQSPGNVRSIAQSFISDSAQSDDAALWSSAGNALQSIQSQLNRIWQQLQQPIPTPDPIQVVNASGALIANIGDMVDNSNNTSYSGVWANNLYVGGQGPATAFLVATAGNIWVTDIYIGGTGPSTAPFFSNGSIVAIGENGQVYILDPYGNIGAWLGTQSEGALAVTGAVSSGGLIELTVVAHGYVTGDEINAAAIGGVPAATGQWVITVVDANHFTLDESTFSGAYTSGGTVNRYFSGGMFSTISVGGAQAVSGVANNGSGGVRVTVTAHGYATGYAVVLTGVGGVPVNDQSWQITVIDANNFDLIGSTFSGSYTGGGLSLNWPTAKLIARADGSLAINNATITLTGTNGEIVLDPTTPQFKLVAGTVTITIDGINFIKVLDSSAPSITEMTGKLVEILGTATSTHMGAILQLLTPATSSLPGTSGELFLSYSPAPYTSITSTIEITGFTTATASAGAATLPANPVGFIYGRNNGTDIKIPFYAA